jgi:GMP synthase (glutamine-hydrolysing)
VEKNPLGREMGTVQVQLSEAGRDDPLFSGLPMTLEVQSTHFDVLVEEPRGSVRLAANENTNLQAFAFGKCVRTVQFHPELSARALGLLLEARNIKAPVKESLHGPTILRNWDHAYVGR